MATKPTKTDLGVFQARQILAEELARTNPNLAEGGRDANGDYPAPKVLPKEASGVTFLGRPIPSPRHFEKFFKRMEEEGVIGKQAARGNLHHVLLNNQLVSVGAAILALCGIPPTHFTPRRKGGQTIESLLSPQQWRTAGRYHTETGIEHLVRAGYEVISVRPSSLKNPKVREAVMASNSRHGLEVYNVSPTGDLASLISPKKLAPKK